MGEAMRRITSAPAPRASITGISPTRFIPTVISRGRTRSTAPSSAQGTRSAGVLSRPSFRQRW